MNLTPPNEMYVAVDALVLLNRRITGLLVQRCVFGSVRSDYFYRPCFTRFKYCLAIIWLLWD